MRSSNLFCMLAMIALSCTHGYNRKYPYTIRDYSDSLQPYLLQALTLGLPGYDSAVNFLDNNTSTAELKKLTLCEHPTLRMLALRVLVDRKGIDHYPIVMDHLDDTAMVATDEGEWGIGMQAVTDFMLKHARWETIEKRNEAADFILMHHNNFRSAYTILHHIKLNEKYYNAVKKMLQYPYHSYRYEMQYALGYLAQFNRKSDIPLIVEIIHTNLSYMDDDSFRLMQQYPDERYLDILKSYERIYFWKDIRSNELLDRIPAFYKSLAVYKNKRAADLLARVLKYMPDDDRCGYSINNYCYDLYEAICENSCEAYKELVPLVEPYIMEKQRQTFWLEKIQIDRDAIPEAEKEKERVSWFQ